MDTEERLAVFIDYENLALGAREHLGGMQFDFGPFADALAVRGRVVVRRAYADWSYFDEDRRMLTRHQVELIEMTQRMGASRKNAADIKMVVDAIEMAFERDYITTFVMCTGDSDFSPLVHKLRELNKRVIGVGVEKSTSRLLPASCDEFLFYDRLEGVDVPDVDERPVRRGRGGRGGRPEQNPEQKSEPKAEPKQRSTRAAEAVAEALAGAPSESAPSGSAASGGAAPEEAAPAQPKSRSRRKPAASKSSAVAKPAPEESAPESASEVSPESTPESTLEELATTTAAAGDAVTGPEVTADESHETPSMEVQVAQTLANLAASTSGAVTASMLKRTLLRKDPTFAEADYGFRTFTEFLEFLAAREFVELTAGPAAGDPEVSLPKQGTSDETFALVRDVVAGAGGPVPRSGLKNKLRKRRPDFSEKALGFRGFLQFCRAAEAAGAVALTWDDDADDYLVTVA
jgi:uncharacterized LabA/DUF88 family protein